MGSENESESDFLPQEYEKKIKTAIINDDKKDGKLSLSFTKSEFITKSKYCCNYTVNRRIIIQF